MNESNHDTAVKLVPGRTFLGTVRGRMNNDVFDFNVYYGNFCCSAADGTKVKISEKTYRKILNNFLDGGSGSMFERPSEEEIEKAGQIAWDSSSSALSQKSEESPQESRVKLSDASADRNHLPAVEADRRHADQKAETVSPSAEETNLIGGNAHSTDEYETRMIRRKKKSILVPVLCVLTLFLTALSGYLGAVTFGIISNPFTKAEETTADTGSVHIVQIAGNAAAGQEITTDMLRDTVISVSEYNVLSGHKYMKPDGTVAADHLILWENAGSLEGKYFSENLSGGHYLTVSEVTDLRLKGSAIDIRINGETVKIPMDSITPGTSNAQLYAIITTGNADGTIKNVAVNLGALKLQGTAVTDVIDSAGYSVMNSITGASNIPQADDDSEENALSETMEPEEVPEEDAQEETSVPEQADESSSEENNG